MSIPFVKMEGCGNDYVFIDTQHLPTNTSFSSQEIKRISHRHTGIGSDGLVLIDSSSNQNEASIRMWNADGSPSKMCGNALRCLALWQYRRSGQIEFSIRSESGIHPVRILSAQSTDKQLIAEIEINMGSPIFSREEIPFYSPEAVQKHYDNLICAHLSIEDFGIQEVYVLSMGNPHCIIFVKDHNTASVDAIGCALENHPAFPQKTNVEFVCQTSDGLFVRTFERGSGETLACGSGACAAHVATVLAKGGHSRQQVFLRGGRLEIEWNNQKTGQPDPVILQGPARLVYEGLFSRYNFQD